MQIYNDNKKDYEATGYIADDIDCFNTDGCFGKMICLKKEKSKEYEVQIIPGRISKAFKEKKKYRFKLAFDTSFLVVVMIMLHNGYTMKIKKLE